MDFRIAYIFIDSLTRLRIFDNRIEVESPGGFPGSVTRENIGHVGSQPRNRQLVDHLREFPTPPNLDAGEGVPMMVALMEKSALYPPFFSSRATAPSGVMVTLLKTDSALKASKRLKAWVGRSSRDSQPRSGQADAALPAGRRLRTRPFSRGREKG